MVTVLHGASVVTPTEIIDNGWIRIVGDEILDVGTGDLPDGEAVDLGGGWLAPGFIDIHCHGGAGSDFGSADPEQIENAAKFHLRHGSTSLLASLVTAPIPDLCEQLAAIANHIETGDTAVIGAHLEGPFLSRARCGAQNPKAMIPPDIAAFHAMVEAARGTLKMITVAPELPGALELIDAVVNAGVIAAVGHTDASYEQSTAAFDRGATVATHLFNGMRPLHHRDPGPIVAALDAGAGCEMINDGVHTHPAIAGAVARHDRASLVLITDAMSATGAGDGEYSLGGQLVRVSDGQARLVADGALAGSTLTMDRAVSKSVCNSDLSLTTAVAAATINPARILGLDTTRGTITAHHHADLLHLDNEFNIMRAMRAGSWQHLPSSLGN
jgi:N-acetylglucosamine-6-phosphate deacetylase